MINDILILVLNAYIKTNFTEIRKMNQVIGCGSITDGKYKLEVHITNYNHDDYSQLQLTKGDKVQVIGSIYNAGKIFI